ncbi:hypothetical protein ABTJ81_19890, partial [Acinetobacter baumannii]
SIAEGRILLALIEGYDDSDPYSRRRIAASSTSPRKFRFGQVAAAALNSFGRPECDDLYGQACKRLSGLGGQARQIDFAPFAEAGDML